MKLRLRLETGFPVLDDNDGGAFNGGIDDGNGETLAVGGNFKTDDRVRGCERRGSNREQRLGGAEFWDGPGG